MKKYKKFTKDYYKTHGEYNRFKVRSNYPYALFHRKVQAEKFIDQLQVQYGIKAELFQKKGSSSASAGTQVASVWDIVPQYGKAFAVQVMYRLYWKGIAWKEFDQQSLAIRLDELKEYLFSMAVRDGKWHNLMYTESELKWYQEFSKLTDVQIQQTLQQAKALYASSRKKEKLMSFGIGGGLILFSFLLFGFQRDITIWTLLLFSFGLVFLLFSLFRLKQSSN